MSIRLLSDIHLELTNNPLKLWNKFIPSANKNDILILAGDVGNPVSKIYAKFLTDMSAKYAKVFIVTGNHEYYQKIRGKIYS